MKAIILSVMLLAVNILAGAQCLLDGIVVLADTSRYLNYNDQRHKQVELEINSEVNGVKQLFEMEFSVFYYDDHDEMNAYASKTDGNLYLGNTLVNKMAAMGNLRKTAFKSLVSHEAGHLLAFKIQQEFENGRIDFNELSRDLIAGHIDTDTTNLAPERLQKYFRVDLSRRRIEAIADFLAGLYVLKDDRHQDSKMRLVFRWLGDQDVNPLYSHGDATLRIASSTSGATSVQGQPDPIVYYFAALKYVCEHVK